MCARVWGFPQEFRAEVNIMAKMRHVNGEGERERGGGKGRERERGLGGREGRREKWEG